MNRFFIALLTLCLVAKTAFTLCAQSSNEVGTQQTTQAAIERYRAETKQHPEKSSAWAGLAEALLIQGKTSEGIEAYRKSIELDPKTAFLWTNLGKALLDSGQLDESVKTSRRSIKLAPQEALSWANLGTALLKLGKFEESFSASEKATQLDPKESIAWNNLAGALLAQGKINDAITALRTAINMNPNDAQAWSNLGGTLIQNGKDKEGIAAIHKATELNPQQLTSWVKLGNVRLNQGKYDDAIKAAKQALQLDPQNADALGILVKSNGQLKRTDRVGVSMARWLLAQWDPKKVADNRSLMLEMTKGLKVLQVEVPIEKPSPAAIQKYYQTHQNRYNNDSVHLRMISAPTAEHTMEAMEKIRNQLKSDEDFSAMAKKYSDDSAATNGGDRGWMKRSDLRQGLADIIFSLKPGTISPVLEDLDHYRIITIIERKSGETTPLEKVQDRIIFKLKAAAMEKKIQQWIVAARKELEESQSQL